MESSDALRMLARVHVLAQAAMLAAAPPGQPADVGGLTDAELLKLRGRSPAFLSSLARLVSHLAADQPRPLAGVHGLDSSRGRRVVRAAVAESSSFVDRRFDDLEPGRTS